MKQFRSIVTVMLMFIVVGFSTGQAAADSTSVVQELTVTARVLPMRHIIIDLTGQISEITSNTSEPVTPQVFVLRDTPDSRRPLTAAVLKQYQKYVPGNSAKAGILYGRGPEASRFGNFAAVIPLQHP